MKTHARTVTVRWENGQPIRERVEPIEVSPSRAREIFRDEHTRPFAWQRIGLPGDMSPGEYCWLLQYWDRMPGWTTFYDAIQRRANEPLCAAVRARLKGANSDGL